jgi:glyoxalase superfamily protein
VVGTARQGVDVNFDVNFQGRCSVTIKNRLHLDVWVAPLGGDRDANWPLVDAEVDRLVALGATMIRRVSDDDQCFVVMSNPEGNEFCACG